MQVFVGSVQKLLKINLLSAEVKVQMNQRISIDFQMIHYQDLIRMIQ